MRRFAWVGLAIALAGCEPGAAGNELGLCSAVCRCTNGLPGQQRACVDTCVAEAELEQLSSACVECVFESSASCTDLVSACFDGGPCSAPGSPPIEPDPPADGF